ncbi:MAG TPA: DUF4395 domain-containing protein [Streptosporangiaceae bacterium]|jgi:hypothetical protein|nr:DUF4395 domain-containing protein [Streptosporangiaceae bacterium]
MEIDPRGPRFGAVITVVVLAVVLITGNAWLLGAQVAVFAVGALAGLRYAPYGIVYRYLIRPRLGPSAHTEAEAPPRFAQGVGMVIAAAGVICYALGATTGGLVFTALALVAAFLNAAFDICLGCQVYLFFQRNQRVRPSA